jgi:hypothetical protein
MRDYYASSKIFFSWDNGTDGKIIGIDEFS